MRLNHQLNAQKNERRCYSQKKRQHTLKSQIIVDCKSKIIICTDFSNNNKHDFRLWEESKIIISEKTRLLADRGYQGIQNFHKNSILQIKKRNKQALTKEEKKYNRKVSRERIVVEHVIRRLKRFKILKEKYRNRQKRFSLRFNLIAGMHNLEIKLKA